MTKGIKLKQEVKPVNVYMVVDRSGSMSTLWKEAVGSINTYIKKLQETHVEGDKLSLSVFDNEYTTVLDKVDLMSIEKIEEDFSSPRGMTALFDAAGKTINQALEDNNEKTVVVIMTDGHENCSREWKKDGVKTLIEKCEKKGWEVIFLGANFDVSQDAVSVGLAASKFVNNAKGTFDVAMANFASSTRSYSSMGAAINLAEPSLPTKDD